MLKCDETNALIRQHPSNICDQLVGNVENNEVRKPQTISSERDIKKQQNQLTGTVTQTQRMY